MRLRSAALLLAVLGAPAPAAADRLITHDGRILEVKRARRLESGDYRLVFESGAITCPARFVAAVEIEGDMSDYVPANADEEQKLAAGYVRYRGKWLSKPAYRSQLAKEAELARERTAELAAHANFHAGWTTETKHFRLRSNTSPEVLAYYAELLETYYDLMDQRFGIDPSPSLKKSKREVSIYKSRDEFTKLTDSPPGVAGFFRPSTGELHFYHDFQDPAESTWIALHEGTHLLTFLVEPQADPWIWVNEGVADYFGAAEVARDRAGRLVIEPGQLLLQRVLTVQQAMADGTHVPLERLFVIPDESFEAFEYAHAWSFVYFLNTARPEYAKAFKKFFKDLYTLAKGVSFEIEADGGRFGGTKVVRAPEVRRLLLAKLGLDDVVALEREWIEYTTAIPIDAPEARYQRGIERMYAAEGPEQLAAALEDLDAALAGGVEHPQAFWARGVLQLILRGDEEGTLADLRAAVERAPLSAGYRASLGQLLAGLTLRTPSIVVHRNDDEEEVLTGSEEALVEAEELLGLACELEPGSELFRASRDTLYRLLAARVEGK